ncbi:MAG: Cytochrome [Rickettsiales bacterium]|nr:Cytochrome [Rickettsiales bacterium]
MKYPLTMRLLHWTIALLIIGLVGLGWFMEGLDKTSELRPTFYFLHKSFGFLTLLLVGIRIAVRFTSRIPALPDSISGQERHLAQIAHGLLYVLMIAVPFSGLYMSMAGGHGLSFFGLAVPNFLATDKSSATVAYTLHGILPYVLIGLVALHALGALKHKFLDKNPENDVIKRML